MALVKPGDILIAKPFLQDGYFKRSVIYMSEHQLEGSLGFILNKPHGLLLKDIFPHLKNGDFPLFEGGPVSSNQLFYTHTLGSQLTGSKEIINGVFWGGDFFELCSLIENDKVSTKEIRFYIGYSGWDEGQLSFELEKETWFLKQGNYQELTQIQSSDMWGNELLKINPSYKAFSDFSFDPSLN